MEDKKIQVTLNGKNVEFKETIKVLEALKAVNIDLPSPCCSEYLDSTHHCGLCLVGCKLPDKDWSIQLACVVDICDGMEVNTDYPPVVKLREALINAYILNHPLDCSLCDKVGDCFLHKFSTHTKFRGFTRVVGKSYWNRKLKRLGDKIYIDNDKCIYCGRCLRFCEDILGEDILGKIKNENYVDEISTYPGKEFNNNYSLNLVDLCPAGAIVSSDQDSYHNFWNLQRTPSISPESSVGINIDILHDKKHIYHIIPRKNDRVNQIWSNGFST